MSLRRRGSGPQHADGDAVHQGRGPQDIPGGQEMSSGGDMLWVHSLLVRFLKCFQTATA